MNCVLRTPEPEKYSSIYTQKGMPSQNFKYVANHKISNLTMGNRTLYLNTNSTLVELLTGEKHKKMIDKYNGVVYS